MNDVLDLLKRWQLDVRQVRERMYRAPTPRERERWHALWLLARGWSAAQVADALERDPILSAIGWRTSTKPDQPVSSSSKRPVPTLERLASLPEREEGLTAGLAQASRADEASTDPAEAQHIVYLGNGPCRAEHLNDGCRTAAPSVWSAARQRTPKPSAAPTLRTGPAARAGRSDGYRTAAPSAVFIRHCAARHGLLW